VVRSDLTRTTFAVLAMGLLIGGSLWVLRPFIGPGIWAAMLVVASWPLMLRLQAWAGGRRWVAVLAMTLALLLLFVVPLLLAIGTIAVNVEVIAGWISTVTAWRPAEDPPEWIRSLPLLGPLVDQLWDQAAAMGLRELLPKLSPYAGDVTKWVLAEVGSIGGLLLQFFITVCIAAVMYAMGEDFAAYARRFAHRLAGAQGVDALQLAGDAIRGVALGVGVTAIAQSALGWVGLALAGVPFAGLLTALMFMLCIAQVGPLPVLLPAAAWVLWGDGSLGWGIFLFIWAAFTGTVDNFIRPVLIRMGADLSLLLIFAGVIGGLVAFGLVGLFVGPVVLAVAMRLLDAWMDEDPPPPAPPPAAPPAPRDPEPPALA
jgi:predicted PurR-regulated permease PerM